VRYEAAPSLARNDDGSRSRQHQSQDDVTAIAHLLDRGVFCRLSIIEQDVVVSQRHGRNRVSLVRCGKQSVLLKEERSAEEIGGYSPIEREWLVYRAMSGDRQRSSLGGMIPSLIDFDQARRRLVLEADDSVISLDDALVDRHERADRTIELVCQQFGSALAKVHSAEFDDAAFPELGTVVPWIVRFVLSSRPAPRDTNARAIEFINFMKREPAIVCCAQMLSIQREAFAFTHGDVRGANLLINGVCGEFKWLVDWELAGFGDPVWDLGCLLATLIFPLAKRWPLLVAYETASRLFANHFLDAYAQSAQSEVGSRERVIRACAMRLLHHIFEQIAEDISDETDFHNVAELAVAMATSPNSF
jgi:hypothetical protein